MYDAVVIGSGLGGLTCASLLSKHSKVIVLEKHTVAGGFATSFRRKKWELEVSLHCLGDCEQGGRVRKILQEAGVFDLVSFYKADYLYRTVFPGGEFMVPSDYRQYIQDLSQRFPEEKEGLHELFNLFLRVRREMESSNLNKKSYAPVYWQYQRYTLQQLLDEFLTSERLILKKMA
jgi:all-trans-retinol 13,14-reductase